MRVWRWLERFGAQGYEELWRDKSRPSRIPPLGPEVAEQVVALTLTDPLAHVSFRPVTPVHAEPLV